MARNQPFDFSDDDDHGIGSHSSHGSHGSHSSHGSHGSHSSHPSHSGDSADLTGPDMSMSDSDMIGDSSAHSGRTGSKSAKQASQTQTASRATTSQQHDSPTSMKHKRGNQPR